VLFCVGQQKSGKKAKPETVLVFLRRLVMVEVGHNIIRDDELFILGS
jgi:hypothetical protein